MYDKAIYCCEILNFGHIYLTPLKFKIHSVYLFFFIQINVRFDIIHNYRLKLREPAHLFFYYAEHRAHVSSLKTTDNLLRMYPNNHL